jgi:putative two-component system response regulator
MMLEGTERERQTILIVDDLPDNIELLRSIFRDNYYVKAANNGETALGIVNSSNPPDIVLLDVMMPGMDGYEICRRLKSDPRSSNIPVIFVTAKINIEDEVKGLELGAADYILRPFSPPIVKARVRNHLALYNHRRELDRKFLFRQRELRESQKQVLQCLGRAAEYKDYEGGMHGMRLILYSRILSLAAGMSEEEAELLMYAASLHDIGKIGIPDKILQKADKLDDDEFAVMKRHCEIGAEIIGDDPSELLQLARVIALSHHEKWNGSGYPSGLAGEAIPLAGRIVAIADAFDALTTDRPYQNARQLDKALALVEAAAGEAFDPRLVQLFVQSMPEILAVRDRYPEPLS